MLAAIKNIDAFPKAFDDFRVKTSAGGLVSIISVLIMAILFFSEMSFFLHTETVDHLYVNGTRSNKLNVDFDISFHNIPCNLLSVDVLDDTGSPQLDAVHDIYKHRLTPLGEVEGPPQKQELGDSLKTEAELEALAPKDGEVKGGMKGEVKGGVKGCGNCYGAGTPGQCCETCAQVKAAYAKVGWRFKAHGIAQCTSEAYLANKKEQFSEDGGCQLYGSLALNKGAGHFHIAPHKKMHQAAAGEQKGAQLFNLMDLIAFTFDQFNVSHTINTLSFGDNFPGISSPLDGQTRRIQDTHGMYQYYVKVVPTRYKALGSAEEIQSNQYSVTEHMSHLSPGSGRGLPGVYFTYEVSPIQAVFEEKRGGLLHFVTSCCAIVGGAFSVMGLVDVFLGYFMTACFKDGGL
ncbi:endoplasmic reticulum vesicle transporter-domain-containing protein [Ochromonadaceae sp. CCMP2298]|nr:endoplasmic reticulum vesicle transporter-domain-containing protein [Ochromonadaceae sp. CCMP2298]